VRAVGCAFHQLYIDEIKSAAQKDQFRVERGKLLCPPDVDLITRDRKYTEFNRQSQSVERAICSMDTFPVDPTMAIATVIGSFTNVEMKFTPCPKFLIFDANHNGCSFHRFEEDSAVECSFVEVMGARRRRVLVARSSNTLRGNTSSLIIASNQLQC
jgi:hypothetical protein